MVSLIFAVSLAAAEEPIELFDEFVEEAVGVCALYGRDEVRSADFDFPRDTVVVLLAQLLVRVHAHVDANDAFAVTEENGKFFANRVLHRLGEVEVDSLHRDFGGGCLRNHGGNYDGCLRLDC